MQKESFYLVDLRDLAQYYLISIQLSYVSLKQFCSRFLYYFSKTYLKKVTYKRECDFLVFFFTLKVKLLFGANIPVIATISYKCLLRHFIRIAFTNSTFTIYITTSKVTG